MSLVQSPTETVPPNDREPSSSFVSLGEVSTQPEAAERAVSRSELPSLSAAEAGSVFAAALCLCLRRYGAPENASLTVVERDLEGRSVRSWTIGLSFADTLRSREWVANVRTLLAQAPVADLEAVASENNGIGIEGWNAVLNLRADSAPFFDEPDAPFARAFGLRRKQGSIDLAAARQTPFADVWPIEQILEHWLQLAKGLLQSPEKPLSALPVLTSAEMESLIFAYNKPQEPVANPRLGFELFDDQVARTPDAPAVTDGAETLTYRELWERSNRLAHYLKKLGVGPETIVGVFLERSIELVVAVIGLQKAGGAYLPIDPGYPPGRLHYVVSDSRVPWIISNERLAKKLPPGGYRTVCPETVAEEIAGMPAHPPAHGLKSGNMSCVFYTSGSTGQPKGVVMQHVAREPIDPAKRKPGDLAPGEKTLLKSAVGFTLILWETFSTLQAGAQLFIVPRGIESDSASLARILRDEDIVSTSFVPSMLGVMVDEPDFEKCTSLRLVYTVGENLPVGVEKRLFARLPGVRLFVFYGCTEAPSATFRECLRDDDFGRRIVVGKPMANKKVYLLDQNKIPVPQGIAGEIHIGGAISREYLHRPELTAQRFLPNPFANQPGERFYRTGDLGRWLPDGNLEFLGRSDFQVQIRGIRIELGEIEAAIRTYPGIKDAVVIAREMGAGDQRLIAYFIPRSDEGIVATEALRQFLSRDLPSYMVPSTFVAMTEWPLTSNGKLDRLSLPTPRRAGTASLAAPPVEPRNTIEIELTQIWKRMLDLDQLGVADDFFAVGGNSLLAMQLVREIRQRFDIQLALADLLQNRTIERIARAIVSAQRSGVHAPQLRGRGPHAPLFHVPGMDGVGLLPAPLVQLLDGDRGYFDALQYPGVDGTAAPCQSIEAIAAAILEQIRRVQPHGPYCLSGYCFGGIVAYEVAVQLQAAGEVVEDVILWDVLPPRTTRRRPLLQMLRLALRRARQATRREWADTLAKRVPRWIGRNAARLFRASPSPAAPAPGLETINRVGSTMDEINRQLRESARVAFFAYEPRPYSGRVDLFLTKRRPKERVLREPIPLHGWQGIIRGPLHIHEVECGHFELLHEPIVHDVAKLTASCLRESAAVQAASGALAGAAANAGE